jgi:hypothetical protein
MAGIVFSSRFKRMAVREQEKQKPYLPEVLFLRDRLRKNPGRIDAADRKSDGRQASEVHAIQQM